LAVRRPDGRRGVRRDGRPSGRVPPGLGSAERAAAQAVAAAVVRGGHGPAAARGRRRRPGDGRAADGEAEAAGGTAAGAVQVRPAVSQRDTRVPERGAVPVGPPAGGGTRAHVARVRVRPQRVRRPLARRRDRAGGPAGRRLRDVPRPGTRRRPPAHGLRSSGRGHRHAGPVPRHVVHRQAEEPGGVPQAGRQPARDPVGRGRLAGQGQRAQVAGYARRPAAHGPGTVPRRQAQGVLDDDA